MVYTQTQQTAMSIFFDSNITFLLREGTITNSIIKMKRICNLLTRQSESFGDLERSIYLSQQEHGHAYYVDERSIPLLLGVCLTLSHLFADSSDFAQLLLESNEETDRREFNAGVLAHPQLSDIVAEYETHLSERFHDRTERQKLRVAILNLCAEFRFHITLSKTV